jgi:cellulose synthase operon protein C
LSDQILGAISTSKNDVDGSLTAYLRAHSADPKDSKPIAAIINTYMQAGKSAEALAFIDNVLEANPNYSEVKLMQGQIFASIGNSQKANKIFEDIIKAQPNHPLAYRELAISQMRAKQTDAAEETINKGIAAMPGELDLKLLQANIYEANERYEEAIKTYEKILKNHPNSMIAANNLASLLLDYRDDKASIARAYELVKSSKDSQIPQLLDTYGWASYKAGKFDEAEKALKLASEKLPLDPIFHFHLAKVHIAKNDNIQAKLALEQAIKYADKQKFDQKDDALQLLKTL